MAIDTDFAEDDDAAEMPPGASSPGAPPPPGAAAVFGPALDEARAYAAYIQRLDLTQEAAARRLGRSRAALANVAVSLAGGLAAAYAGLALAHVLA